MANASSITPMDRHEGKTPCVWLGKATLAATGALATEATVTCVVRTPGVTAKDLAFADIIATTDVGAQITTVVCTLDTVTITIANVTAVALTDGPMSFNIVVFRGQ